MKKIDGSRNIGLGVVLILLWIISGAKFSLSMSAESIGFNLFNLLLVGGGIYFIIRGLKQRNVYKNNKKEENNIEIK